MSQYDDLDSAILYRLAQRPLFFVHLNAREVRVECERLAKETGRKDFRILDCRLQALRKRGAIAFDSKTGWSKKDLT